MIVLKLGSPAYQIQNIIQDSPMVHLEGSAGYQSDAGKYEFKQGCYSEGITNSHDIGSRSGIRSAGSVKVHIKTWNQLARFAKEFHGIKDVTQITPGAVSDFLQSKIADNVSINTYTKISSSINKFDDIVNSCRDTKLDYSTVCSTNLELAKDTLTVNTSSRAFEDPRAVINSLSNDDHKIVATLQLDCGLRVGDVLKLDDKHLLPNNTLQIDNSKNGFMIQKQIPADIYKEISQRGVISVDYNKYLDDIKNACRANGEVYSGSHSFRHNFAQTRYDFYRSEGMTDEDARKCVSEEMQHHRIDVIKTYLR